LYINPFFLYSSYSLMGGCFQSSKLQSGDLSSGSFKSNHSIGGSLTPPVQGISSIQIGSSSASAGSILNNIKKEDNPKMDFVDMNSGALADLISPRNRSAKSKLLFEGSSSLVSSNISTVASTGMDQQKKSDEIDDMSYTQHLTAYENQHPTEILPTIYLGSQEDSANATRLKEIGITHILCVMSGKEHKLDGCKLLTVVMSDNGNSELEDIMKRSFRFIEESQQKGNKLLIHCKLGQNRSPTLLIAWLMRKKRWPFYRAYKYVKEAREMIKPHQLYLDQLRELDKQIFGIYSTPNDYLAIGYAEGKLTFGEESITAKARSAYKSRQISAMTPPQLAAYHKSQLNITARWDKELEPENDPEHKSTE